MKYFWSLINLFTVSAMDGKSSLTLSILIIYSQTYT